MNESSTDEKRININSEREIAGEVRFESKS